MHYVYILRCADDSLYVGETSDVVARVLTHQAGEASGLHESAPSGHARVRRTTP
ncbi:GIY-YIG nuclease family protein [Luteitalea sp. TBR-22]|uniref:GIY-YIG nuclease family protein n=1 Tax=Luteitalea sp. TBR-22 TaxID=2802971 RepID=UPI00351DA473